MFIPDPTFFHPGSEIMIRVFIPDPDLDFFFTHPGSRSQGSKKAPDPESGFATLRRRALIFTF
jgi:hypothetical protein